MRPVSCQRKVPCQLFSERLVLGDIALDSQCVRKWLCEETDVLDYRCPSELLIWTADAVPCRDPLPYILRHSAWNAIIQCISVALYLRSGAGRAHST
jgi:hypothetical protein